VLQNRVLKRKFECKNQKARNSIIRDQIRNEMGGTSGVDWRDEG